MYIYIYIYIYRERERAILALCILEINPMLVVVVSLVLMNAEH